MSAICPVNQPCPVHRTELSESFSVMAARLAESLEQENRQFIASEEQNLGEIEMELERQSRELLRQGPRRPPKRKLI